MFKCRGIVISRLGVMVIIAVGLFTSDAVADDEVSAYGLGRAATQAEIQAWDIDISPNGDGLPAGQGTVNAGKVIYADKCSSCHGPTGIEGPMPKLVGGLNTLHTDHPSKTVGSYWPFATTLFDYIYRSMPFTAPQSLTPNEVYAVVAWILYRNEVIEESKTIDARSLTTIHMPNRNNFFVPDPRPDISQRHP